MADWTPTRTGQALHTGDDRALFLKKFSGEVLTAFHNATVTDGKFRMRTISSGKSASFGAIGTTTAGFHTPGAELTGNTVDQNERVINIDNLLVAHNSVANIDEAMQEYDVRGPIAREQGLALAKADDKRKLQLLCLASRATTDYLGNSRSASTITSATAPTDADVFKAQLIAAAQKFDETNVPMENRYAFIKPAQYYLLLTDTDVMNKDWGGTGSLAEGTLPQLAGLGLVKTNNLPSTNLSAITGEQNTYSGDYRYVTAVVGQEQAIGTVSLMGLSTEMEYSVSRQATLLVSKFARGSGILRPECAVEIVTQ